MEEVITSAIIAIATKYPVALTIIAVIGTLRVINKPAFALARAYTQSTESKSDDEFLDQVEQSKVYKTISFVLDWTASVKLPTKKQNPIQVQEEPLEQEVPEEKK